MNDIILLSLTELNIISASLALILSTAFGRDWKYFVLPSYLMFRSILAPFIFKFMNPAMTINLVLGLAIFLSYVLYMTDSKRRSLNVLFSAVVALSIVYLWVIGHFPAEAAVSYAPFVIAFTLAYGGYGNAYYMWACIFSLSWYTDVRELVIIFGYDVDIHFPYSFFLIGKYLAWLFTLPLLVRFRMLREKKHVLLGLIPTVIANALQVHGVNIPWSPAVGIMVIRVLPLLTILAMLRFKPIIGDSRSSS